MEMKKQKTNVHFEQCSLHLKMSVLYNVLSSFNIVLFVRKMRL
jgi:hypothetical protein